MGIVGLRMLPGAPHILLCPKAALMRPPCPSWSLGGSRSPSCSLPCPLGLHIPGPRVPWDVEPGGGVVGSRGPPSAPGRPAGLFRGSGICLRLVSPLGRAAGGPAFPGSAPAVGKGTMRNRHSVCRAGEAGWELSPLGPRCMLFGLLWLCSQRGGQGSSSLGKDAGCLRGAPVKPPPPDPLLPRSTPGASDGGGTSSLGLGHCPPALDRTRSLPTAEAKSVFAREEARALGWHLERRRASRPLPGGFPGTHVSGPLPPGVGISPRSLSRGHPVAAGADSQHTPGKLDTPTLKIPDGSCTGSGGKWQAPQAGAVVPLLVSAFERDASGSFAAWHPHPRTACPLLSPALSPRDASGAGQVVRFSWVKRTSG